MNDKTLRRPAWVTAILLTVLAIGCGGPGNVRFDHERCYVDGRPANLAQIEEGEALVEHRIAVRQPLLIGITVIVVLLAGIGYVEKLVLLLSAGRDSKGIAEHLRAAADRYRAHRLRYFGLVGGSVALLVSAGVMYIWLDADKRGNERALASLQFCHLALRTSEETSALTEQRQNLASIHETASEIRQLIDKLPPTEQVKAQEIIGHMDEAVGRERRLITDRLEQSLDTAQAIRDGTISIEKDLSGLQSVVGGLKDLPASVKAVADGVRKADEHGVTLEAKAADLEASVQALRKTVEVLASRPPPTCPACVCSEPPAVASASAPGPGGRATKSAKVADMAGVRPAPPEPTSKSPPAASTSTP